MNNKTIKGGCKRSADTIQKEEEKAHAQNHVSTSERATESTCAMNWSIIAHLYVQILLSCMCAYK